VIAGYILAENMRPGARLEGLPLSLTKIERYAVRDAMPDQFRYRRGDETARAGVAAYGRSVGVPDSQLDWDA
jgi:hypothetical protein